MTRPALVATAVALALVAGCAGFKAGREFPSPEAGLIVIGQTDKAFLERTFGPPYEVGIDSGDSTWTWFYGQTGVGPELSKSLTVRFDRDGRVKSYAFSSNFPEDMRRLK